MKKHLYIVNLTSKSLLDLGPGHWPSKLSTDPNQLLEELIFITTNNKWSLNPSYVLWLRDYILEFIDDKIEITEYIDNYNIVANRFGFGGKIYVEHVLTNYKA